MLTAKTLALGTTTSRARRWLFRRNSSGRGSATEASAKSSIIITPIIIP